MLSTFGVIGLASRALWAIRKLNPGLVIVSLQLFLKVKFNYNNFNLYKGHNKKKKSTQKYTKYTFTNVLIMFTDFLNK